MSPSGLNVANALERAGFVRVNQRGSHLKLRKVMQAKVLTVIVPLHDSLAPGTLSSILRQAGMSKDELRRYL